MKDYIKKKFKKIQKYSVEGHGGHGGRSKDEQRAAAEAKANRIEANAAKINETFNQLNPPFGADLLLGSAKLQSVELLSDGPIKGFFDLEGKSAPVLHATFIDDTPVVASSSIKVTHKNLKLDDCKACQIDYTTGVRRYLMDFRAYLSTGIGVSGRKHPPSATTANPAPEMLKPRANGDYADGKFRGLVTKRKDDLVYALGGSSDDRLHSIQFAANLGIDTSDNITSDLGKGQCFGFENQSGGGYRISPYAQQSFYGQDQITNTTNFTIPTKNFYTPFRPLKYQGAMVYGAGLNTLNGNIETAFVTRAFHNIIQGFFSSSSNITKFETGYADQVITDDPEIFSEWGKTTGRNGTDNRTNGTMRPLVTGDIPYVTRHFSFQPGSEEPYGLIEPHLSGIFNLITQLPNKKETQGFIFKQKAEHDLSRFSFHHLTGTKHESLTLGGQTNRHVLELRGKTLSDPTENHFNYIRFENTNRKNTRKPSEVGADEEFDTLHNAGYTERSSQATGILGLGLKAAETYRLSGSYYIPAGAKVSGLRFFTATPEFVLIGGPTSLDARSKMDQWVDFNATWTASTADEGSTSNHAPGTFSLAFMDFTTDNSETNNVQGQFNVNDQVFIKNLTIAREDFLNETDDFVGSDTGYLIFPADADSYTFFTGSESSRIKPKFDLSFSFGSGAAIKLGEETLKYVVPDVDGFSGIKRDIVESIVLETDVKGEDRNNRTSKPFNITGNRLSYEHVVGLEENRPKKFKGAILFPVYLGPEGTAMSGVNEEFRLDSLSRVMIFPNDDHEVKQLKYQSGVQYNYDVFSGMEDGNICYANLANPNVISNFDLYDQTLQGSIRPTGHGYPIQIRLEEREADSFNYPNIYVASRDGSEVQDPLVTKARTSIDYGKNLLGPYVYETMSGNPAITGLDFSSDIFARAMQNVNPSLLEQGTGGLRKTAYEVINAENWKSQDSALFVTGNFTSPSLTSADLTVSGDDLKSNAISSEAVREAIAAQTLVALGYLPEGHEATDVDGTGVGDTFFPGILDFNDWNSHPYVAHDEENVTHIVERSEVDSIAVVFNINSLSLDHQFFDDPDNFRAGSDRASIHFQIEAGFEGVSEEIFEKQKTNISYEGVTNRTYSVETNEIPLPTYDQLLEVIDESIEDLKAKFKRYVTIRKLDYETLSTRVNRRASVYSIIENVNCNFTYPFSALVRTELDARNFQNIPIRTFNARLKKVLIPSNYFPLGMDGKDKRFIKDANSYQGDAKIYDGDWDGSFKFEWTDNPAWILYDLLTNTRYGIGNFLDDTEDINVFNLYKIARYCDAVDNNGYFVGISDGLGGLEPRFSANLLINQSDSAFEIINQISAIFNGNAFWANGVLDFYSDRPVKPAAIFNNSNVFDGYFNYQAVSKASNFNCVSVQFQDKSDNFTIKYEVVEDEDGIRKDGKLIREVNGRGATSRGQARRLGKYVLYSNKLEREIVYFKAGLETLMLNVGDIIEISDELKQFEIDGARVLEVNTNDPSIAIENTININSIDNEAFVYAPSGQTGVEEMYDEIRKGGLVTNQRLSGMSAPQSEKLQISSAVPSGDNAIKLNFTNTSGQTMDLIRPGSFAALNLKNNASQTFRVIKITPEKEKNIYSVTATEYNSGKFNFIEGTDENFNLTESTPFNIGIPEHTIKELTQPNSFNFTQTLNDIGTFDLNFTINGELNGNEEVYLISVVYPNGVRKEKRVRKSNETSGGFIVTTETFKNLEVFGTYNVFVSSIK